MKLKYKVTITTQDGLLREIPASTLVEAKREALRYRIINVHPHNATYSCKFYNKLKVITRKALAEKGHIAYCCFVYHYVNGSSVTGIGISKMENNNAPIRSISNL